MIKIQNKFFHREPIIILFILFIFLPAAIMPFIAKKSVSNTEKRKLAPLPDFSSSIYNFKEFTHKFELFMKDNFGFRNNLIMLNNYFKVAFLKKSPLEKVVLGKEGWLFLTDDGLINDFRGFSHPNHIQLETIRIHLKNKNAWLKNHSINYLFVLPPNKQTIYPEFMPDRLNRVSSLTRCDILMKYLSDKSDVPILDLRPFFLDQIKKHEHLYYLTDAHWNEKGAFLGYEQIMKRIKHFFPDINVLNHRSFEIETIISKGLDTANMLSLSDFYEEENPSLKIKTALAKDYFTFNDYKLPGISQQHFIERGNPNSKYSAIIFRDSFCTNLIPYLSESFNKIIYIWSPYKKEIMEQIIKVSKPDIVIEEITERLIGNYYGHHACYTILAEEMINQGEYMKAVKYLQLASKLSPDSAESYYNLGFVFLKSGKFIPAVRYFYKTLKMDPHHLKAKQSLIGILKSLSMQHAKKGEYDKAASLLKKLVVLDPEDFNIDYNLACIYSLMNMPEKSIKWLKNAIGKGYANWGLIETDKDLEAMRKNKEYKILIDKNAT